MRTIPIFVRLLIGKTTDFGSENNLISMWRPQCRKNVYGCNDVFSPYFDDDHWVSVFRAMHQSICYRDASFQH